MTDREQNMVKRLKMLVARVVIDLDDEKVLEIIKKATKDADERPKGEWIAYQMDRWIYAKCPECAYINEVKTNFCPNCGIPMEVKSEQH